MNLIIRKLVDAVTVSRLFTPFVYSVTRPFHNTTTAVIPRVVPKTPLLRLLVFGACFYHTFYRPEFRLHGYVFFRPGARCRDFTWAYVPPQHIRPPRRCACGPRAVGVWLFAPVRFPVAPPAPRRQPPFQTVCVTMPMCISMPIWVWQRVRAEDLATTGDESQRWKRESPQHLARNGDVVAHTMRCPGLE